MGVVREWGEGVPIAKDEKHMEKTKKAEPILTLPT